MTGHLANGERYGVDGVTIGEANKRLVVCKQLEQEFVATETQNSISSNTHTHPFNGSFSGTTRVSWYQKGKTNLDFTGARDSEWQWHQLGICKCAPRSRQITTPAPHHSAVNFRKKRYNIYNNNLLLQTCVTTFVMDCFHCQSGELVIRFVFSPAMNIQHSVLWSRRLCCLCAINTM